MGVKLLWSWTAQHTQAVAMRRDLPRRRGRPHDGNGASQPLLVDGFAWLFRLTRATGDGAAGVDYAALARELRAEVEALREAALEPVIVLDGCRAAAKAATTAQRTAQRVARIDAAVEQLTRAHTAAAGAAVPVPHGVLGVGALATALDVLRAPDLRVRVVVCDGEADGPLEREAARTGAIVLSDDSDLLVAPGAAVGGCATLRDLDITDARVHLVVYRPHDVCRQLGIAPAVAPLFAALVGNDYLVIDTDLLRALLLALAPDDAAATTNRLRASNTGRIAAVAACLAPFATLDNAIAAIRRAAEAATADVRAAVDKLFASNMDLARDEAHDGTTGLENTATTLRRHDGAAISPDVLGRFRTSALDTVLMTAHTARCAYLETLVEDAQQVSAWVLSRPLRAAAYALVLDAKCTVTEYLRRGANLAAADAVAVEPWAPVPYERMHTLPRAQRQALFFRVVEPVEPHTSTCPWALQFVVAAIKYVAATLAVQHARSNLQPWEVATLVHAAVLAAFACNEPDASSAFCSALFGPHRTTTRRAVHVYAWFQAALFSLGLLANALQLPADPAPWCYVRADLFYALHERGKRGVVSPFAGKAAATLDPALSERYTALCGQLHSLVAVEPAAAVAVAPAEPVTKRPRPAASTYYAVLEDDT